MNEFLFDHKLLCHKKTQKEKKLILGNGKIIVGVNCYWIMNNMADFIFRIYSVSVNFLFLNSL